MLVEHALGRCCALVAVLVLLTPVSAVRNKTLSLDCQPRVPPPGICGPPSLWPRSYTVPRRWPAPSWQLVMELQKPGTCDLYASAAKYFCCALSASTVPEPERHVFEAISSFLTASCLLPGSACHTIDLGANNGNASEPSNRANSCAEAHRVFSCGQPTALRLVRCRRLDERYHALAGCPRRICRATARPCTCRSGDGEAQLLGGALDGDQRIRVHQGKGALHARAVQPRRELWSTVALGRCAQEGKVAGDSRTVCAEETQWKPRIGTEHGTRVA